MYVREEVFTLLSFLQLSFLPHFLLSLSFLTSLSSFFLHFSLTSIVSHHTNLCFLFPPIDSTSIEVVLNCVSKHEHCPLAKINVLLLIICWWSGLRGYLVKLKFLLSKVFWTLGICELFVQPGFKQTRETYPCHKGHSEVKPLSLVFSRWRVRCPVSD